MEKDTPNDDTDVFDGGFRSFPKRLPDDCVEYTIHVVTKEQQTISATRTRLNEILRTANEVKKQYLRDYIWQRQSFELSLVPKISLNATGDNHTTNEHRLPLHLRGRTDFGDSVADEWLIVFILREISKRCPDAWIRVCDTDGEFLLIEAAKSLPKWLNPDIAENRVWLNQAQLKIIPMDVEGASHNLDRNQALSIIQHRSDDLLRDPAVEEEAFYRLQGYPSAISSSLHHTLLTLPRRLAYILRRNPAYISPAVESFYLRDPVSLKPLTSKDLSTLVFAPEDFVTTSVKFTKVGFAQLRGQVFDPPPAWTGIIPKMRDEKVAMGMKLTCGFEMLINDSLNQRHRIVQEIKMLLHDLECGEDSLPSDLEVESWPKTQDDETWLDIDFNDFEKELAGNAEGGTNGFGDQEAQANLQKMVSRFQDFLEDDDAGAEGVDGSDEDDSSSDEPDDATNLDDDDSGAAVEEADFEKAVKETQSMSKSYMESSGLLEEARRLAMEDGEDASDGDDDEEMQKVMELMKKELKEHGALQLDGSKKKGAKSKPQSSVTARESPLTTSRPIFGPERPPHMPAYSVRTDNLEHNAEVETDHEELSSDDEEFNDVDIGLAKNMLESFKGQAGLAGPAGSLMKALGVAMPRDEDND